MITKDMIRIDLPEYKEVEGYCNMVLAIHADEYFCKTNTCMPVWSISNVAYYLKNQHLFKGWIELEHLLPPEGVR